MVSTEGLMVLTGQVVGGTVGGVRTGSTYMLVFAMPNCVMG